MDDQKEQMNSYVPPAVRWSGWLLLAFIFAPSPYYTCLDGCLTQSFIIPFPLLAFTIIFLVLGGPALSSPTLWIWHGIFMIPFLVIFMPLKTYLDHRFQGFQWRVVSALVKLIILIVIFAGYWYVLAQLWLLIPEATTQTWLGQRP